MAKNAAQLSEDDLTIELDDVDPDALPEPDEPIEEAPEQRLAETGDDGDDDPIRAAVRKLDDTDDDGEGDPGPDPVGYDEAYERAQAAEAQVRNEQASRIWERANSDASIAKQQLNNIEVGINATRVHLENAQIRLALAQEAEDRTAVREAESAIRKAEQLIGEFEASRGHVPNPEQILQQGRAQAEKAFNQRSAGEKVGAGLSVSHPLAKRWASVNTWTRSNERANQFVINTAKKMADNNWDPDSPSFYSELSRRVAYAFPKIKVANLDSGRRGVPAKGSVRSPVAPGRSARGGTPSRAGAGPLRIVGGKPTYRITGEEQARMRRMNLDPSNKEHQKAWAHSRLESAQRDARSSR